MDNQIFLNVWLQATQGSQLKISFAKKRAKLPLQTRQMIASGRRGAYSNVNLFAVMKSQQAMPAT
jgi:hypothetical protein